MFFRFFFLLLAATHVFAQSSPFKPTSELSAFAISAGEEKKITISIPIPEGFFIYQEKTSFQLLKGEVLESFVVDFPTSVIRFDPFFKKESPVFVGPEALIQIRLRGKAGISTGEQTLEGLLTLQGCSDKLCYPPETHLLSWDVRLGSGGTFIPLSQKPEVGIRRLLEVQDFSAILSHGFWIALLIVFAGGILTSLTPCVLPLIPMTLLVVGVKKEAPVLRNLSLSIMLVLGIAFMYSGLGLVGVLFGKTLGFFFQSKTFVWIVSLLLLLLGLAMFDLFSIPVPAPLLRALATLKESGLKGAFFSGLGVGIFAAPCAGPVVGALLLFIATSQAYLKGFLFLFTYALGIGMLFLILGTGFGTFHARIKGGRYSLFIKKGLGLLLILAGLFFLNSVVSFDKKVGRLFRSETAIAWVDSLEEGLAQGRLENKKILIDFYADWCGPCKEMEYDFFKRPEVEALLKRVVPIRFDATFTEDPNVAAVFQKYNIIGMPTVLFLNPDGSVIDELRVLSYNPELLLRNLKEAAK